MEVQSIYSAAPSIRSTTPSQPVSQSMATASTAAPESEQLDPWALCSWVYLNGWASKRPLGDGQFEISCLFRGCKKKYKVSKGSTSNIDKHLKNDHHLTKAVHNNGTNKVTERYVDQVFN